jgi:GT2 family glycosyltransferase
VISAIVPTWRGRERLGRNLGSVAKALQAASESWEIVVVDDGGGDTGALLPGARLVALPENRGYGPAVNAGVGEARGEYLLILNDDAALEETAVARLRRHFPDPLLFAVVPSIVSRLAACGDEAGKRGILSAGLIEMEEAPGRSLQPTLYPVGCCFLCPRELFVAMGGYDELFAPFFWEDTDLGYRAWRRGLRILYDPGAVCRHEGSATLNQSHTEAERERVFFRNRALFHLRNLQDPGRRLESLGALAAFAVFEGRAERIEGLREALHLFGRAGARPPHGLSDAEILTASRGGE